MIPQEIADSLAFYFSHSGEVPFILHSSVPLSGGCINNVHRLSTNRGDFCLKYNRSALFPEMFEREADGLSLLRKTGEIRVPEVVCSGYAGPYAYLLLEFIQSGRKISKFMDDFGRSLARLHRHTADAFGNNRDNYMGALLQQNKYHKDWVSFFIEERLEPQVLLGKKYFSSSSISCFERLYNRLGEFLPNEPPALLHGDLWSGNLMVSAEGKACLIDPAVYYGNREVDLAMTTLFGGFESSFYDAYLEEFPLNKGWQERLDIYNLYPLLIHLNLFGSGYLGAVEQIIRRF